MSFSSASQKPNLLAWCVLACGLTAVVACRSDPDALFAEAEQLRQYYEKEASHQAILKYREAQDAWIRAGGRVRAAKASQMLGETHEQLGLLQEALRDYLEAESLCRESCDPLLESAILSDVGLVQAKLADSDETLNLALAQCQEALSLAREASGLREEAEALTCAGEVEYHRGNLHEALELYRQAKPAWESVGDSRGQAERLFYEGTARSDLSQFGEAKASLEEALAMWTSSSDKRGEAMALIALGRLEWRQGKNQNALNHFRQALDRLEPVGDRVWEASGLAGIGNVYLDMGNGARARSYWEAALERVEKTGLHTAAWDLLLVLGQAHLTLEDPSQALDRFQEALALAERMRSDRWQVYSLHLMSQAYQSLGEPEESLECLGRALELQRSARDPRRAATIQAEMGNTYELMGSHERAAESFGQAVELSKSSSDRLGEAMALFGLARVTQIRNDLDGARKYLERSLDITESLRTEVESRELRTSYSASVHDIHELYVDVLMQLHKLRPREGLAAAAFEASERARARSLLEILTEAGVDIRAEVDPSLLDREASLKQRLEESWMRQQRASDEKEGQALDTEIEDLEANYDQVQAEIRSKSPRYSALARPAPLGLEEVQEKLLDDDTLLLEYALGEERSFLWAVSKDDYASFELGPRADIEGEAERPYELLTARARVGRESLQERNRRLQKADAEYREVGARLSQTLLGPVAERMAGKRLLVVADGALQYLPFGALPVPGRGNDADPMIEEHEIVNLPSASALAVLRQETLGRKRPRGTVAVFADPVFAADDARLDPQNGVRTKGRTTYVGASPSSEIDSIVTQSLHDIGVLRSGELRRLEGTRHEATAIGALASEGATWQAIGFDATRAAAMSPELGQYRIVHFASHGVSNIDRPAMSGIILSLFDERGQPQNGFLSLRDIYDLKLSADLVVLSACSTALGQQILGEGIVGIVTAFLYAGAERVVATLWEVDDEATRELMSHFYQEMFQAQRSPSAALRQAQLSMRDTEWDAPFFWAAFVLQGDWQED
ncbi:MAG TPA: CHAT domain-containing protein [Vicinamibacteria bacterium]|nr:CHAT domain-containing protein [Vicinamibacteria bacterium]